MSNWQHFYEDFLYVDPTTEPLGKPTDDEVDKALAADPPNAPSTILMLIAERVDVGQRFSAYFYWFLRHVAKHVPASPARTQLRKQVMSVFGVSADDYDEEMALMDWAVDGHEAAFARISELETLSPRPDQREVAEALVPFARARIRPARTPADKHLHQALDKTVTRWVRWSMKVGRDEPAALAFFKQVQADVAKEKEAPIPTDPAELEALRAELLVQAKPVLEADDPLVLTDGAFRKLGYGGDTGPAMIVHLAMTTRLLVMRPGSMPAHILLVGIPGAGKSYTMMVNLALLPRDGWHAIDAGSPKVLIYDPTNIQHRVLVFSEADSLPGGEDNPAASAIRALLQDHELHYDVVVRDAETGGYVVHTIRKAGPTLLATTAIHRLGPQLDSRLFVLEVPEDRKRVKEALMMRARVEQRGGVEGPDAAVTAYQALLALDGPYDVHVPFAEGIARAVGESSAGPRILRDFERLLSLIKAAAIQRVYRREQAADGRVIATLDDYAVVYGLVGAMYEGTTGATKEVRDIVRAVGELVAIQETKLVAKHGTPHFPFQQHLGVTGAAVARHLGIYKMAASRRIAAALEAGWLLNQGQGKRQALVVGDDLPAVDGLPTPEALRRTPMR